jgi:S-phase kinase-associated protein 1
MEDGTAPPIIDSIKLRTASRDAVCELPRVCVPQSSVLKSLLCEGEREEVIDTILTTQQLCLCIEFMVHHQRQSLPEIERPLKSTELSDLVPEWDAKFIDLDLGTLYKLILAANFLDIRPLLDLACAKVASFLKGKSTVEMRRVLGIKTDYTPEEEAAVREENKWVSY